MEVAGQLLGLAGHLSPLAGYCADQDRALLLDVWPETHECWVALPTLHAAMCTTDSASGLPRGWITVNKLL